MSDMANDLTLVDRRKGLGISQDQLAALLGVTQGTVSRNETAENPDRRYVLSLDALAARKAAGEDLVAASEQERERTKAAA